jgi:hypothetical protein
LERIEGKWEFDQERTFSAWRAEGMPEDEVDRLRESYADAKSMQIPDQLQQALRAQGIDPGEVQASLGKIHPDMTLDGHVAVCAGMPSAEYRFFGLHEHGTKVCGKAWHHEDRFDPGDMSKCYVRLAVVEDELYFEVRMQDGMPDLDDSDLKGTPSIVADPQSPCDADAPKGSGWPDWKTYVFVRSSEGP